MPLFSHIACWTRAAQDARHRRRGSRTHAAFRADINLLSLDVDAAISAARREAAMDRQFHQV